jgi:uncharacterized NAD(P)/FAD-binding protein YdhS
MSSASIAIIGAGFSGTLLALHLMRRCPPATRIVLIERNSQFGRGQAYATGNSSHLLNVPAGRMSAFHDQPGDFLAWLQEQSAETLDGTVPAAGSFVSRSLYGAYIRHLLNRELGRVDERTLELVHGEVLSIDRTGHPLVLQLDRGRQVQADLAVLAVGNFPPAAPGIDDPGFYNSEFYHADPWAPDALDGLGSDDPVLLIGTGLTMVDTVISLLDNGHTGPIHAVSRRGLLPRRHAPASGSSELLPYPTDLGALTSFLRMQVRQSIANGGDWRTVVDGLRPFTVDIWQRMSLEDRRRFLRHARPWWEVHRHRMAPQVADRIEAAQLSGQLRILPGRIVGYNTSGTQAEALIRLRGEQEPTTLPIARVVNCAGPSADYDRISHPLVQSLMGDGTAQPDKLRLGLDVTGTGALVNRSGAISRRIFAVGPVTKGTFWEMTAVPDIRRQAELLALHLAGLVKAPEGIPAPTQLATNFAI